MNDKNDLIKTRFKKGQGVICVQDGYFEELVPTQFCTKYKSYIITDTYSDGFVIKDDLNTYHTFTYDSNVWFDEIKKDENETIINLNIINKNTKFKLGRRTYSLNEIIDILNDSDDDGR